MRFLISLWPLFLWPKKLFLFIVVDVNFYLVALSHYYIVLFYQGVVVEVMGILLAPTRSLGATHRKLTRSLPTRALQFPNLFINKSRFVEVMGIEPMSRKNAK